LRGSGADSGTFALTAQNSAGTNTFRVRNDGYILIGQASTTAAPAIYAFEGTTGLRSLRIGIQSAGSLTPIPAFNINQESNYTYTSGTGEFTTITANFLPTSGTGTLANLVLRNTINQTGGANGITRGLYVNPTLTAAADWRSIEWSNNSGWGLYGAGTANNYLGGNLLLGSTSNSGERLQVTGTMKVTGNVTLQNTAGANRSTQLSTSLSSNGLASLLFYPSEGTNVGQSFDVMPKGTGFSATQKAQFAIWGTDYFANQTNYELLLMRTTGTSYTFESFQGGTGSHRPLLFSAGVSNQFWVYTSGNIGVNTSSDVTSALLHMTSTTKGFLPPRMTTTQKNAIATPAAGLVVYDTTLNKLCVYTTAWETITSV
jgi:hypothetical protein